MATTIAIAVGASLGGLAVCVGARYSCVHLFRSNRRKKIPLRRFVVPEGIETLVDESGQVFVKHVSKYAKKSKKRKKKTFKSRDEWGDEEDDNDGDEFAAARKKEDEEFEEYEGEEEDTFEKVFKMIFFCWSFKSERRLEYDANKLEHDENRARLKEERLAREAENEAEAQRLAELEEIYGAEEAAKHRHREKSPERFETMDEALVAAILNPEMGVRPGSSGLQENDREDEYGGGYGGGIDGDNITDNIRIDQKNIISESFSDANSSVTMSEGGQNNVKKKKILSDFCIP